MALQVKQGVFQLPLGASGTHVQIIEGVGFQPKAIIFYSAEKSLADALHNAQAKTSIGFATGPEEQLSFVTTNLNTSSRNHPRRFSTSASIIFHGNPTASQGQDGAIASMDPDGFTIQWKYGGTVYGDFPYVGYLALGGDDLLNAKVHRRSQSIGNGVYSIDDVGFQPNTVLSFLASRQTTDGTTYGFGVATPTGQWGLSASTPSSTSLANISSHLDHDVFVNARHAIYNYGTAARLTSFDPTGFTIEGSGNTSYSGETFFLSLEFTEPAIVGTLDQPSSPLLQSHSLGKKPAGLLFASRSAPSGGNGVQKAAYGLGMSDGTSGYSAAFLRDGAYDNNGSSRQSITSPVMTLDTKVSTESVNGLADAMFTESGFTADWLVSDGENREVVYLAFMQTLPVVEASSDLSSSSELAVQVNGSYGTSTSTSSTSIMSSVLQATRTDSLTVVAGSSLQIGPSAAYGITATCTFSSDMTAMTSKATDTGSSFESHTDMASDLTRIQFGEMSGDVNGTLTLALQRARFDQWSVLSHSDLSVYPILLIDGSVRLSALSDIEAFPNAVYSSDAFIQTESGIYVRLSPRLLKSYEKVFAQPQIRLAIAKQIGLPHGEFQ